MSGRIKVVGTLLLCLLLLSGCYSLKIPVAYRPGLKDAGSSVGGSWVSILLKTGPDQPVSPGIEGELIGIKADTLIVLTVDSLRALPVGTIDRANLFIFKKPIGKYAGMTGLFLIPAVIGIIAMPGDPFFIFALAPVLAGFVSGLVEGFTAKNELKYPAKQVIYDFRPYSRFPQGIPAAVNLSELKLLQLQ